MRPQRAVEGHGIPDFKWINKNVPIHEVVPELDLQLGSNGLIRCWHPEHHHNGDRTPSVGIWRTRNRIKCFGCACGLGPFGPIDLVKDVLSCSEAEAGLWIADRFAVPTIPLRQHLPRAAEQLRELGAQGPMDLLVCSGFWAGLPGPARQIAPVFLRFAGKFENQEARATISYRTLRRYSGLASDASVRKGIVALQELGWLRAIGGRDGIFRQTATYVLTPWSDIVMEAGHARMRTEREEIKAEKELRQRARKERNQK